MTRHIDLLLTQTSHAHKIRCSSNGKTTTLTHRCIEIRQQQQQQQQHHIILVCSFYLCLSCSLLKPQARITSMMLDTVLMITFHFEQCIDRVSKLASERGRGRGRERSSLILHLQEKSTEKKLHRKRETIPSSEIEKKRE